MTQLFLDGSQLSLQSTLNELEIYGTVSGLVMNTSKTKVIWLGQKRYSKYKLTTSAKLHWDNQPFNVLGITFDKDLIDIIKLNYEKVLADINKLLACWGRRHLTLIGKISVIKTFCLSKLNHLFLSLPSPSPCYIQRLKKIFYTFIWDHKPEKIKRSIVERSYKKGD